MRRRTRPAFSLLQLLLLLAILVVLLALLLPAVLKVRTAAARSQSFNNLKQIGIACHGYHDVNNALPPGCDDNHFSAAARLLPYIEQDNLYKLIDFKKPCDDKANAPARAALIKTFLSPGDPITSVTDGAGPTNYLFVAGSKAALADDDGMFYQDSRIRLADVTDGLSNTLMAVETLKGAPQGKEAPADPHRQYVLLKKDALKGIRADAGVEDFKENKHIAADRCASWMDGRFLQGTFTATLLFNDTRPDVSCAGLGGVSSARSLDGSGTPVLLGDGSVHYVSNKVKFATWQQLANRADGQAIDDPNY